MPDNKEHKIFSKEELFKLIDEKKALPDTANDFDKEAMEGLSMLKDRKKVDSLNDSIDEVLLLEKKHAKKKRNIYILSAAASLILIVGLFFLLKQNSFEKNDVSIAENKTMQKGNDVHEALEESVGGKKSQETEGNNPSNAVSSGEAGRQEAATPVNRKISNELKTEDARSARPDVAATIPPAEVAVRDNDENLKTNDVPAFGKDRELRNEQDYKALEKKEEAKKADKVLDKEKDTRYVTNTVWTSPASGSGVATDESKGLPANKAGTGDDMSGKQADKKVTVSGNNNPAPVSKNAEIAYEKQANGPAKKAKAGKEHTGQPDTTVSNMLAGYSYYDQNAEKSKEKAPSSDTKNQQQPVQSQTKYDNGEITVAATTENEGAIAEEKAIQEVNQTRSKKHETGADGDIAKVQTAAPKAALKTNESTETSEFIGGNDALQQFVKKNLKISAPKRSGTIVTEFRVKKDGSIDTAAIKISSPIKNCDACSKDVINLLKVMPAMKPCDEKGKAPDCKRKLSIQYNAKLIAK